MNIWIDLGHIPQFNFYKPFILRLSEKGHRVYVTVLGRGRLPKIVQHELAGVPNVSIEVVGHHRMTKWSAIIEVNLLRIPKLWFWALGKHLDIAFSNHHQTGIVAHLLGIPSYAFGDDPQTKAYWMYVHCTTKSHMLVYEDVNHVVDPKDTVLRCTKEWAYLAPSVFRPKVSALGAYNLRPKEYIFVREVSVGTVNYANQSPQAILQVADLIEQLCEECWEDPNPEEENKENSLSAENRENKANASAWEDPNPEEKNICLDSCPDGTKDSNYIQPHSSELDGSAYNHNPEDESSQLSNQIENSFVPTPQKIADSPMSQHKMEPAVAGRKMKVVFSLEEKHRRDEYPEDWILLQEPIEDIHSLMYYSAGLVSSGDSMAREAAMMGIPSYYLGTRHSMPANLAAAKVAGLQNELTMPFEEWLGTLRGTPEELMARQEALRAKINQDFIDINAYMMSLVEG